MECKHCGQQLPEGAKFCTNCGAKVEVVAPVVEIKEEPVIEEKVEEVKVEYNQPKEWYFVENNASLGPFTQAEMAAFIGAGRLNNTSFVWKEGMSNWTHLDESPLKDAKGAPAFVNQEEETIVEEVVQEEKEWYYIINENQQQGPVTLSDMKTLISMNSINGNTYVWKAGMGDWQYLKYTELSQYLNVNNTTYTQQNTTNTSTGGMIVGLTKRNIAMNIVLSIVTCGFYGIYWLYTLAEDTNKVLTSQGKQPLASGGMLILLTIVTCGIYSIYYFYKVGKALSEIQFKNGYRVNDDSIIMMLLCIFQLGLVSYCILQGTLNDISDYASL